MTALDRRLSLFFIAGGVLLVGSTASAEKKQPFLAKTTTTRQSPLFVAESCPLRCPSDARCVKMNDLGIELDNGKGYSIHGESGQVYFHGDMLHQDGWVCEQSCPTGTMGAGCSRRVQACGSGDDDDAKACLHGGTCIENQGSEASEQFVCDCTGAFDFRASTGTSNAMETDRYVGRFCEQVVESTSYCARDAELFCINGGTCRSEDADDFHTKPCDCPETHTGKHCEFDVTVAPLDCTLDCGHHGECRNGRKKDTNEGADAYIDFSDKESMNYMFCECHSGHTGALCEYDFISCGDGDFEHFCFHGSVCEQFGDLNVCSCETANGRVAGDACQYKASDECERVTGGATPNGAQFCVNNGTCEQELATGTTYCNCGDGFGGNQCEAPVEDKDSEDSDEEEEEDNEEDDDEDEVPKPTEWPAEQEEEEEPETPAEPEPAPEPVPAPAPRSPTIHLKFEPENQAAPTPAPTPKATSMGSMDGTYMDQDKFVDLDFPLIPNDGKHGAAQTESAHHHGEKKSSSSTTEEGLSAAEQFGVFVLLATLLTVFAVFVYRRHRRKKFSKEVISTHNNTNLRAGAGGSGDSFKDQVYKDAIYDADGKLDAVEIL